MKVEDEYVAYCLDEAVHVFGGWITSELDKIEGKNSKDTARKQQRKLTKLLGVPDAQRFRSFRPGSK